MKLFGKLIAGLSVSAIILGALITPVLAQKKIDLSISVTQTVLNQHIGSTIIVFEDRSLLVIGGKNKITDGIRFSEEQINYLANLSRQTKKPGVVIAKFKLITQGKTLVIAIKTPTLEQLQRHNEMLRF